MLATTYSSKSDDRQYEQLLSMLSIDDGPLFQTNVMNLFETFLEYLPDEYRQHYTCSACRHFVNRYGTLVKIDDEGNASPAIWNTENVPLLFDNAIRAMNSRIINSSVCGVFYDDKKVWGTPVTGEWHHMHIVPPIAMIHKSRLQTPYQEMAEKSGDFAVLGRSLGDYQIEHVEMALTVLRADALYRSEKVLGVAEWLYDLMQKLQQVKHNQRRRNLMWRAVATAPNGFCHVRNTMIGTLLDDIASGMSFDNVKRRFDAKMHPLQYQRPQAAPTTGNIAQAEKIVEQLGIASSLRRRFARIDEIMPLWEQPVPAKHRGADGVFGHLKHKSSTNAASLNVPAKHITWIKFEREVMPTAEVIKFYARRSDNYVGLMTAVDMDAPPILQWDMVEQRNPVSWYVYSGGSTPSKWGIDDGWNDVTAITLQPSMWHGGFDHMGKGVIFIIAGAVDQNLNSAALFPEILNSELRHVRSTIEAYSRTAQKEGQESASACGVMLQSQDNWGGRFLVKVKGATMEYIIDRWD